MHSPSETLSSHDQTNEAFDACCDVLVIGGGVNGAGVARDLAGRGWSVVLCEQDDLAAHTSSASTKLIHGGLRYLEYGDFGLVRKALIEREGLLTGAPHIMWPLRFVLPHDEGMRPAWMIRLGLWLYDHLAPRRFLPASQQIDLRSHAAGKPLQPRLQAAFEYADGWVDDARLVVLCAMDARDKGARILTHTKCTQLDRDPQGWQALLAHHDPQSGRLTHHARIKARLVINAAGPWADHVHRSLAPAGQSQPHHDVTLRLVKGSHIVVPKLFSNAHAYIMQQPDGRIVFAIPYEQHFTLVGTTDEIYMGNPADTRIGDEEIRYLCAAVTRYFKQPLAPDDVVWHFSGVRPLLDDKRGKASAITRDYRIDHAEGTSPWITLWGGKITTFRVMAQQAADLASDLLGESRSGWTRGAHLPGGDLLALIDRYTDPVSDMAEFQRQLRQRYPWIDLGLARRWCRQYGSDVLRLLDGVSSRDNLGQEVAPDLYEAELFYLRHHEWACTGEDVLWRRTKLGLHYTAEQRQAVIDWMARCL
jgi:glycerol-3-phosphate dehydrogenase